MRAGERLVEVIAHRGASSGAATDNSLDAFAGAIEVGADGIELDVRRTRDGELIAFHDATVDDVPVSRLTRAEIESATGSRPPLLAEVIELTRGRVGLDIELKEAGYVERVVELVDGSLRADEIVITSFLDRAIAEVGRLRPAIRCGLLIGSASFPLPARLLEGVLVRRVRACGAEIIAIDYRRASEPMLARAIAAGLEIYVWTVNDRVALERFLADERMAAVITDDPALALRLRG